MPLLTDEQLTEWRTRIHEEYLVAERVYARAVRRERLYRRYVLRHLAEQDNNRLAQSRLFHRTS